MSDQEEYTPIIICNIINHGHTYDEWSTSFIIGMSKIPGVKRIKVMVTPPNGSSGIQWPEKFEKLEFLDYRKPLNMLRIPLKMRRIKGDPVIIVYGPTAFGEGNLSNLIGMILPVLISKLSQKNVKIINQGSVFTHDSEALGYKGLKDKLRRNVVKSIEKFVYKRIRTYFQLDYYKEIVTQKIGKKSVAGVMRSDFIDPIATLYLNDLDNLRQMERNKEHDRIRILLHGFWGPQKDPETALIAIKNLKRNYKNIDLIVSGGINHHFPGYAEYFRGLLNDFNDVIDKYLGYVDEKELAKLFIENEIVLMPYRASGGQSGVLEFASFFENIVVCTDFPEFREEKKSDFIILTNLSEFELSIEKAIEMVKTLPKEIEVQTKIRTVVKNISNFLFD